MFENILAIGGIAHNEQFLRLPKCFQKYSKVSLKLLEVLIIVGVVVVAGFSVPRLVNLCIFFTMSVLTFMAI